jgi:PKD repeat protein
MKNSNNKKEGLKIKYQNRDMFRIVPIFLTILFLGLMSASFAHAAENYTLTKSWSLSGAYSPFPAGIATDSSGNVYVADYGNNLIEKFSSNGILITEWSFEKNSYGKLGQTGITVDPSGNVYVIEGYDPVIEEFSPNNTSAADFTSNLTNGSAPLSVQFTDKSTGSPTAWKWDFGDVTASTEQNPKHTYSSPGNYTVSLTVTYASGDTKTATKEDYINVNTQLKASFTASPTKGATPLTVTCKDMSTGNPVFWTWNFGDGTSTNYSNFSQYVKHTYNKAGNYTISLTVQNARGSNTAKFSSIIVGTPAAPTANFTAIPTTGYAPLTVSFTDNSYSFITSRNWNFGDGSTSTQNNTTHTYTKVGNYTVNLTVTNAAGWTTLSKPNYIIVKSKPLVANFTSNVTSGNSPLTVTFKDTSTGSPTSWKWNFGDGTSKTTQNPIHTYSAAGNYTVKLTVTNAVGNNTTTKTNYIKVTGKPVAAFSAKPTSGNSPLTVTFKDVSTGSPTAWKWSFGDGSTKTTQNPIHTYSAAGNYAVKLIATNALGSNTTTKTGYIVVK